MNKNSLLKTLQELDENAQILIGVPARKYSVVIIGGALTPLPQKTSPCSNSSDGKTVTSKT